MVGNDNIVFPLQYIDISTNNWKFPFIKMLEMLMLSILWLQV